jgi:NAD-dependent deacetylase
VFFGESVPMLSPAAEEAASADVFVIIGTRSCLSAATGAVHPTPLPLLPHRPKAVAAHTCDPTPNTEGA